MRYERSSQWPNNSAAGLSMIGVFPRHSTLIFKESLAVISLALALGLLVLALTVLAPRNAWPQTTMDPAAANETWPAGLFFRSGRSDALLEAPSLKSDVVIRINGEVARTKVRQRFVNPADVWLEGVYVFPLPQGSAVDRLIMEVGERRIEGRILPRKEAEAVFKQAAAEGRKASLLSSERPNVFVTSVANIGPGERITIEIEYQNRVLYRDGRFELRFPMVVAPRYTPGSEETPMVSAPRPAPAAQPYLQPIGHGPTHLLPDQNDAPGRDLFGPVRKPGGPRQNRLSLAVHLDAGLPLAKVESLYHAVTVETESESRRILTLAAGSVPANRDFVLAWALKTDATPATPRASLFAEEVDDETYLAVTLVPPMLSNEPADDLTDAGAPAEGPADYTIARELILIVDTSGSMHGPSLEQAKRALMLALDRLDESDRFNLIRFDSVTEALFDAPRPAERSNLLKAAAYVASFRADGGTRMRPALDLALKQAKSEGHLRQIVFLTDGAVSNETELFSTIAARLDEARLFTIGLGSAPNGYFMRKAAEVGRGSFVFIGDLAETGARMSELFRKLENPVLTDISIGWPSSAGTRVELHPSPLPDLYAGETVTFTARLSGAPLNELDGELLVTGRSNGERWQQRIALAGLKPAPGVAALWARAKIAGIRDGLHLGEDPKEVRAIATKVALRHQLVTVYTSLVAVDERISRPTDELWGVPHVREELPRELPEGWSYEHVFGEAEKVMKLRAMPASFMQQIKVSDAASGNNRNNRGNQVQLPQTATPATQQAILGLGLSVLGLLLLLVVARPRRLFKGALKC
jgi:Ca-activated chloride channel family protein